MLAGCPPKNVLGGACVIAVDVLKRSIRYRGVFTGMLVIVRRCDEERVIGVPMRRASIIDIGGAGFGKIALIGQTCADRFIRNCSARWNIAQMSGWSRRRPRRRTGGRSGGGGRGR